MVPQAKPYSVTIVGATGHVGRHCVRYLEERYPELPYAIAGRNRAKLQALADEFKLKSSVGKLVVPDLTFSERPNEPLAEIVAQSNVILSTAGPYELFGESVVRACVDGRAHYVDITGEGHYVRRMIEKYGTAAERAGVKIVPFCGFDSVPADVGSYLAVRHAKEGGVEVGDVVSLYKDMKGGVNGGTIRTMFDIMEKLANGTREEKRLYRSDAPLSSLGSRTLPKTLRPTARETVGLMKLWVDGAPRWTGPFIMTPVNSAVTRSSAAVLGYGARFRYCERYKVPNVFAAAMMVATFTGLFLLGRFSLGRAFLGKFLPKPGEGPSDDNVYKNGYFAADTLLWASGKTITSDAPVVKVSMSMPRDASNGVTAACACEAAVGLASPDEVARMPQTFGVMPPVVAMGEPYVNRIEKLFNVSVSTQAAEPQSRL